MEIKSLSITVAGAAFSAVLTLAIAPVQAAPLDFNFTTERGATGSFTLETDTPPSGDPALLRMGVTGISYPNAVSNFSFSAPYINLSSVTTDFNVVPSLTSDFIGLPANLGVVSAVSYPAGCITAPGLTCLFDISVLYSGNLSELPKLSDNPNSYSIGLGVDFYDPTTRERLHDDITNLQVVRKQPVPESNSGLGVLGFGIALAGLLLKRNSDRNKPLAI
ncbi:hypothetical protein SAMD00079811_23090 [Scytonema sp. HK-05]|uniref:hypothetical protein n=1 Tax=Scytonema sp. HK-05 TaxID=1137095 RepID=UPI00093647CC|nr:hypothetical protein [Scytonema sp. HK-05]OKH60486.1 hypothetical protein NIES2130_03610 [Scytonema sp. HK-05]BAY44708.1 hypothetical protein SAMD00079811_23090 [Scytonema sp. HK-05]